MGAFTGMDPKAVRDLAGRLDGHAARLAAINKQVTGLMRQSQRSWRGRDADDFVHRWTGQHYPKVDSLVEALKGLAQSARNNADEQEGVSRDTGVGATLANGGSVGAHAPSVLPILNGMKDWLGTVSGIVNLPETVRTWQKIVDGAPTLLVRPLHAVDELGDAIMRTDGGWLVDRLIDAGSGRLDDLAGRFMKSDLGTFVDDISPYGARLVDGFGKFTAGFTISTELFNAFDDVRNGDFVGGLADTGDAVAAGIKGIPKPTPVTYLVGVNVDIWTDTLEAGRDFARDFRPEEGIPSPLGENWSSVWVPALKETGNEIKNRAIGWLL